MTITFQSNAEPMYLPHKLTM